MSQRVGSHLLPPFLVELIASGRWKCPEDDQRLRELTDLPDVCDLRFCSVEQMREYTEGLCQDVDDPRAAATFGLASSRRTGRKVALPLLDVDRAVMIALTYSDSILCLDYRDHPDRPAVVVSDWSPPGGAKWQVIAPDIETFAELVGL